MNLSVDIEKGLGDFRLRIKFSTQEEVTGLLGASGCGKSLTLRCIAGVERPDRGRITLDGRVLFDSEGGINLSPQERRVGYLFQSYALFPHMTVEQNIRCGFRREVGRGERDRRLGELLELLQLRGQERLRPAQLSGGQQQRTALARILASDPALLLLDEPFSALDSHLRDQLQPQLRELLHRVGRQALLVTHSRDEAYRMCGRLCVMDRGEAVREGATRAVFADPGSVAAARLTGCKNIAPARKAGEHEVEVPGWGVRLTAAAEVPDTLAAVGIRAHHFRPGEGRNAQAVTCVQLLEEPFEWNILFRFSDQDPGTPDLWWRVAKGERPEQPPRMLGVAPEQVLLLTR